MSKQLEIYVDDDYFDLVPRPTKEQRKALKQSIQEKGQLDPIICDSTGKIVDGHTRFEICQELKLKPKFKVREFTSEEESKEYAVISNLKRRHLNAFQIVELTQFLYDKIKEENKKRQYENMEKTRAGKQKPMLRTGVYNYKRATSYRYGEEIGVDGKMVNECRFILQYGSKLLIKQVREGELSVHSAYRTIAPDFARPTPRNNSQVTQWSKCEKCGSPMTRKKCHVHDVCCTRCDHGIAIEVKDVEPEAKPIKLPKEKYRSSIGILFVIVNHMADNGNKSKISEIARICNLSHYAVIEKCDLLKNQGIVTDFYAGRNRYYELTDKGKEFGRETKKIIEYLKQFHLETQL